MAENGNRNGERLNVIITLLRQLLLKQQRSTRLLRSEEAAAYLGISKNQLYTLIRRKELPTNQIHKEGGHSPLLIDVHELDALIERTKN